MLAPQWHAPSACCSIHKYRILCVLFKAGMSEAVRAVQANITLDATSGSGSAANAITSTEDITVAMEIARNDPTSSIRIQSSPVITKLPECGDDLCSPGEATTRGAPPPPYECPADCPIVLGTCPSPGSSELGNSTKECGGLGSCARGSLTCGCFSGFDGEACGHCAEGYRQVGEDCEVILSLLVLTNTTDPVSPPNEQVSIVPSAACRHQCSGGWGLCA